MFFFTSFEFIIPKCLKKIRTIAHNCNNFEVMIWFFSPPPNKIELYVIFIKCTPFLCTFVFMWNIKYENVKWCTQIITHTHTLTSYPYPRARIKFPNVHTQLTNKHTHTQTGSARCRSDRAATKTELTSTIIQAWRDCWKRKYYRYQKSIETGD